MERLSEELRQQLWLVFGRILNTVQGILSWFLVATAVRYIENEERADAYVIQAEGGFLSPDRQKR